MRMNSYFAFVIGVIAILAGPAAHAAPCTVPNLLTNGQPSDAAQVMANFNSVSACASAAVTPTGSPAAGNITQFSGSSTVTNGDLSGDVTTSGNLTTTLSPTGVAPGSYINANITVDAKGRVTSISSGTSSNGPALIQSAGVRTSSGTATSASVTLGATPTVGNVLIGIVSGFSNGSVQQTPAGFNTFLSNQNSKAANQGILVYSRVVQPGDGANWTTNFSGSNNGGQTFELLEVANLSGITAQVDNGGPSGTTWVFGGAKANAGAITLAVLEADQANGYSSISGPATLFFDGTGGGTNHPSVFARVTGFGTVTVTYTGSGYTNPLQSVLNFQ